MLDKNLTKILINQQKANIKEVQNNIYVLEHKRNIKLFFKNKKELKDITRKVLQLESDYNDDAELIKDYIRNFNRDTKLFEEIIQNQLEEQKTRFEHRRKVKNELKVINELIFRDQYLLIREGIQ
jgi:hypothetical protein